MFKRISYLLREHFDATRHGLGHECSRHLLNYRLLSASRARSDRFSREHTGTFRTQNIVNLTRTFASLRIFPLQRVHVYVRTGRTVVTATRHIDGDQRVEKNLSFSLSLRRRQVPNVSLHTPHTTQYHDIIVYIQ